MQQQLELANTETTKRLRNLEGSITRSFVEAGLALREIRDSGLFRLTHRTFDQYCRERWSMAGRNYANRLINAANFSEELREAGVTDLPRNEFHCRPIFQSDLSPEERKTAWLESCRQAKNGVPTSERVRAIVDWISDSRPTLDVGARCRILTGKLKGQEGIVSNIEGGAIVWVNLDNGDRFPCFAVEVEPIAAAPISIPDLSRPKPNLRQRVRQLEESLKAILGTVELPTEIRQQVESLLEQEVN